MRWPRAIAALPLFLLGPTLTAQVVRGKVTERTSQAPLSGVLVELLDVENASERVVASTLSATDGEWAIRAPRPGRYVVAAKRIGVQRLRSEPLQLGDGETMVRDLVIDAVLYVLPEVRVSGLTCDERSGDASRVASLWEEARTALVASQISLRERRFRATVTRYVRELDPKSKRVMSETRSEVAGVVSRPFTDVDGDSLSVVGYWVTRPDGSITYHAPDADVMLSDAFLRDHCFREVAGGRDRRGLVGLGFRPLPTRAVPDVVGALWLDARTFELRFVEFHYSQVHAGVDSADVGGELHFARLPGGAWIIRRWFLRLPVMARPAAPVSTEVTVAPWVLVRPALRYREEGGEVAAAEHVGAPPAPRHPLPH